MINNFKDVYVDPIQNAPPDLEEHGEILGYTIFRSNLNTDIYVIFDEYNKLYHVIEDVNSPDVDRDLERNIRVRFDIPEKKG